MTTREEQDRIEYAGWVARQLEEFRIHAGDAEHVWNFDALTRAKRKHMPAPEDIFKGPWHVAKKYATTEFREWVDEYWARRLTFTEYQSEQRHQRERERIARIEYEESGDMALDSLDLWRDLAAKRDALIVQARTAGKTYNQLMAATGMSRSQLAEVVRLAKLAEEAEVDVPDMMPADWTYDPEEVF